MTTQESARNYVECETVRETRPIVRFVPTNRGWLLRDARDRDWDGSNWVLSFLNREPTVQCFFETLTDAANFANQKGWIDKSCPIN